MMSAGGSSVSAAGAWVPVVAARDVVADADTRRALGARHAAVCTWIANLGISALAPVTSAPLAAPQTFFPSLGIFLSDYAACSALASSK